MNRWLPLVNQEMSTDTSNLQYTSSEHAHNHHDLFDLRDQLRTIYKDIGYFTAMTMSRLPILDSCVDLEGASKADHRVWNSQENIPGLRILRDLIKKDLAVLDQFLADSSNAYLPPLSTNAPYLIAVWHEVLCAPPPVTGVFQSFTAAYLLENAKSGKEREGKRAAQKTPCIKVDVVADGGRQWIRVNTIKNSRLLSEFHEMDSYLTDSSEDTSCSSQQISATGELNNSVLQMGRALLSTAEAYPIVSPSGTVSSPRVVLRLTRLIPYSGSSELDDNYEAEERDDPRVAQTISALQQMRVHVVLGERHTTEMPHLDLLSDSAQPALSVTRMVNLDLSLLLALVSDIVHSPLPQSTEDAHARFIAPGSYVEWKKKQKMASNKVSSPDYAVDPGNVSVDTTNHSRALAQQCIQEIRRPLLQEMHSLLSQSDSSSASSNHAALEDVQFWTTVEARDRCFAIVDTIGGPNERRRAHSLFLRGSPLATHSSTGGLQGTPPAAEAENSYWQGSRYPLCFLPIVPIRTYPCEESSEDTVKTLRNMDGPPLSFLRALEAVARGSMAPAGSSQPEGSGRAQGVRSEIREAGRGDPSHDLLEQPVERPKTSARGQGVRITPHTSRSVVWGAQLGWTTMTANRTSVRALLRQMKLGTALLNPPSEICTDKAALWVVDPRSLAEGMRAKTDAGRN